MLPAGARLRRSADFTATLRTSRAVRAGGMMVLHAAAPDPAAADVGTRVGFVVPRAVGPAVTRNQVRRRLRHLLRDRLDRIPAGTRMVVRVLPPAAGATSAQLAAALDRALDRTVERLRERAPGRAVPS